MIVGRRGEVTPLDCSHRLVVLADARADCLARERDKLRRPRGQVRDLDVRDAPERVGPRRVQKGIYGLLPF